MAEFFSLLTMTLVVAAVIALTAKLVAWIVFSTYFDEKHRYTAKLYQSLETDKPGGCNGY